jgi:hypothetical protein
MLARNCYPFRPHQGAPHGGPAPHALGSEAAPTVATGFAGKLNCRSMFVLAHLGHSSVATSASFRTSFSNDSWHSWQVKS